MGDGNTQERFLAAGEIFIAERSGNYSMARKPRRKFRRYIKGIVDETLPLTALAARDVVTQTFDDSVNERTWISSVRGSWSLDGLTHAENIGPIMVGIAHSDYTDAEIEEFIENTGSWDEGDLVSQEVGKRKIRIVGIFQTPPGAQAVDVMVLNDGKPITTKCGWILNQGQTLDLWAYNLGSAAVATTVPNVHLEGHANLWPN